MKHPLLPRGAELGLPILSGILLTLAFPPFHLLVPPFVALVPYLVFVAGRGPDPSGAVAVRRGTFWMGVLFYGTLLYWLFAALVFYTWLALLGYVITVVILSGILSLAGWGIHYFRVRRAMPLWLAVPIFWTAAEWARAHLGDVAFPWLGLGHSLTGFPALVGVADLSGARGLTVWLAAINGLLAEWYLEGLRPRWPRRAAALALLVALPVGYSLVRWNTLKTRPVAEVLVVQPNIPEDIGLDRDVAVDSSRTALGQLTGSGLAGAQALDLVVWPEAALATWPHLVPGWVAWARSLAADNDVSLLYGFPELQRFPDGSYDYYNAALLLDQRGSAAGVYRKRNLVPMVERVPFVPVSWTRALRRKGEEGLRLPLLGDVMGVLRYFGGYGRGEEGPVFSLAGSRFGVLICYESIFPELARGYRSAGADFLVNITNDAWFGRERPWWSRTSALYQHPAHLVMRAVENRIGVARAANTGISLFVDPRGRIYEATQLFQPAQRLATVETTDGLSFYTRVGDWPGWICAAAAGLLAAAAWWRSRRRAWQLAA
ncbi:MAG: apolipoprotein N-acyltransferase [Gemmatimonadota bacterium]|nr:MAG: apolipoprotein N-acyltransferase [Gemmatimonadota bacterium]